MERCCLAPNKIDSLTLVISERRGPLAVALSENDIPKFTVAIFRIMQLCLFPITSPNTNILEITICSSVACPCRVYVNRCILSPLSCGLKLKKCNNEHTHLLRSERPWEILLVHISGEVISCVYSATDITYSAT